ncbi:MAG: branched-chain amino acid ABC transporter permease [Solirubrobacteraceae bacterium]
MRYARTSIQLLVPIALIVIVAVIGESTSLATQQDFLQALVMVTIVVGIYVFSGNSGVISLGHVSFVALGAFTAGVLTVPVVSRPTVLPDLFGFLQKFALTNFESLALAAALGALYALVVGIPLMRLSGFAAGIATFAVLEITNNVFSFWGKIGPADNALPNVPDTTGFLQATVAAIVVVVIAFAYQRSRPGRLLRAAREDPYAAQAAGIHIYRQRLLAFTLSGALAGLGGGLYVHFLGSIEADQVYLDMTFLTLAMLVIGGAFSLWGAVLGAVLISLLDSVLAAAENGTSLLGSGTITIPTGSSLVILGALMAAFMLFRQNGITNSREVALPTRASISRLAVWRRSPAARATVAGSPTVPEAPRAQETDAAGAVSGDGGERP